MKNILIQLFNEYIELFDILDLSTVSTKGASSSTLISSSKKGFKENIFKCYMFRSISKSKIVVTWI